MVVPENVGLENVPEKISIKEQLHIIPNFLSSVDVTGDNASVLPELPSYTAEHKWLMLKSFSQAE